MSFLQTMGTHSCATIAIGSFKGDNYERNEEYLADKNKGPSLIKTDKVGAMKPVGTVDNFYNQILYPTIQDLGRTVDYPFDMLMDEIDKSCMHDKYTVVTLHEAQMNFQNGYWPNRLKERGFDLVDRTKNNIGSMNYIFVRNKARPAE